MSHPAALYLRVKLTGTSTDAYGIYRDSTAAKQGQEIVMKCIVCLDSNVHKFGLFDQKLYWKCQNCEAKFLDKCDRLTASREKMHYLQHENKIADKGYRNFLSRLKNPFALMLSKDDVGLDYGCGNGPALAEMFREDGFTIDLYDPFFFPNKSIFGKKYDFITCTEAAEHFHNPFTEFKKIDELLKAGGKLGVMTTFSTGDQAFENWHYRRDPTHVVFYNERTFRTVSLQFKWNCIIPFKDIVLISKS